MFWIFSNQKTTINRMLLWFFVSFQLHLIKINTRIANGYGSNNDRQWQRKKCWLEEESQSKKESIFFFFLWLYLRKNIHSIQIEMNWARIQ